MELVTNRGEILSELSESKRVLLVFLRHFGCTFCRETMSDLEKERNNIESSGIKIVFVHMTDSRIAEKYFSIYNLKNISHISDPEKKIYSFFGLTNGTFLQLFGVKSILRVILSSFKGHLPGRPVGDPRQMPGMFLLHKKTIINNFTYKLIGDRPNYKKLIAA